MAADRTRSDEFQAQLARRATDAAQAWHAGARVSHIEPLTGGASSLTFVAHIEGSPESDHRIVLKVAPPGLAPVRNRDVLRQARVMRALHGRKGVVVPRVLFADEGDPPETPPFVAMGLVAGNRSSPRSTTHVIRGGSPRSAPVDSTRRGCSRRSTSSTPRVQGSATSRSSA